ncbi:MAG: endonuclease III domain-containing protein, partial [Thermoguttaceae bacterium]
MSVLQEMLDCVCAYYANVQRQEWWPDNPVEVIFGALLVPGTKWQNVARVLDSLKLNKKLNFDWLRSADITEIEQQIRSVGFQQRKAPAMKEFAEFLYDSFGYDLKKFFAQDIETVRSQLLEIKGIGLQTVNNILLYAGNFAVYSVDKFTHRILLRHGIIGTRAKERDIQQLVQREFSQNSRLFNDFQAHLVQIGRDFCDKSTPKCLACPL